MNNTSFEDRANALVAINTPKVRDLQREYSKVTGKAGAIYLQDWLGVPIIQRPDNIVSLQHIIWSTKPDIIIETGVARGGSIIFNASMLGLLNICLEPTSIKRFVIGIDIDIRPHTRSVINNHPLAPFLKIIEGSSVSESIVSSVKDLITEGSRVMVHLDSNHTHDHVISELNAYAHLVTPGCYCVVSDTIIEELPQGYYTDRPWDKGNNPKTAVDEWLLNNNHFVLDCELDKNLLLNVAIGGHLKRIS